MVRTIRREAGRQAGALIAIAVALAAVLAYSAWGSYLLHHQTARAEGPAVADNR